MLLTLYFFVVIALPMALGIYVALTGMQRSRVCPTCAEETLRIQSRLYRFLSLLHPASEIQRRWCLGCGWLGTARLARDPASERRRGPTPFARNPAYGEDRVDIRRLNIDGMPWKVTVQCWAEGGRWIGRFLFVGPDGRACVEEESSLEGDSAIEVLSSALSIPEQALAGRIRRAIH